MFATATFAILLAMLITIVRALLGPTLYDRILATNIIGTMAVLFISVFGFLTERPEFLDIALLYTLVNFITTIAVLKNFEYGSLFNNSVDRQGDKL